MRKVARQLKRSPSTISRELRRNAATRPGSSGYRAVNAQWHADRRARRPKAAKLVANTKLRDYVKTAFRARSLGRMGRRWQARQCG